MSASYKKGHRFSSILAHISFNLNRRKNDAKTLVISNLYQHFINKKQTPIWALF